jgi:retron-type reverse transcriptase
MTLQAASIDWSLDFVARHSDGDLFPKMPEIEALLARRGEFIPLLEGKPLGSFLPGACRRFIVPKDQISYRQATQLDPQDSIILTAIVHQFGCGIESRRLPSNTVFSYRFNPTPNDGLYGNASAWNDFWTKAHTLGTQNTHILYCDIADFYNQIYHHTVENQLIASGFPNQATKWIISLLESTTAGVSRGVPIGPHAAHLIAESTMIPIDNSLQSVGMNFIRYADDIIVFCNSDKEARSALAQVAAILDKQQRLMLQRHKTKFYAPAEFRALCSEMIQDRPINPNEAGLLALIRKYSGGNPYLTITYNQISDEDWQSISESTIRGIIQEYLSKTDVDFIRLRWFYRRLSQIGHPGAINVTLENVEKLGPCFANICFYLASVQSIDEADWKQIGSSLLDLLDEEDVRQNEYFRLLILSLFSRNAYINHFAALTKLFQAADPFVRREIFLAAKVNGAFDWVREYKESFQMMDPWQKIAYLYCVSGLPPDDKKYFINRWTFDRPFEQTLAKWSKNV